MYNKREVNSMKRKNFRTIFLTIALFCCIFGLSVGAETKYEEKTSLKEVNAFLLKTGITNNQLLEMKDTTKLEVYETFKDLGCLDDEIQISDISSEVVNLNNMGNDGGISPRNIPTNKLKMTNYSFHNHQMGRAEIFGEFEWLVQPFDQVLNNDSYSFALDNGWDILPGSESLKLYRTNGELDYNFTRPSSGNKNGSSYRIATATLKEFRGIKLGVLHCSIRPNNSVPVSDMSTYLEFHYTQDATMLNNASYSIGIGPMSIALRGGGTNVHEAFLRTSI